MEYNGVLELKVGAIIFIIINTPHKSTSSLGRMDYPMYLWSRVYGISIFKIILNQMRVKKTGSFFAVLKILVDNLIIS